MNMYSTVVKIFVIVLLVCFFIPYGASAKTHQMGVVDTLRGAIEVYSDINGHAPGSWSELMTNGDTKLVQRLIEKEGEFVHCFRFLNSGTEVHIGPEKYKVLAMSTTAWYGHESKGDSRILFFLTADGLKIDIIEETRVRRIFTEWGYNLDDYTGPGGKWEPERSLPDVENILKNRNEKGHDQGGASKRSSSDNKANGRYEYLAEDIENFFCSVRGWIGMLILLMVLFFGIKFWRQSRRGEP